MIEFGDVTHGLFDELKFPETLYKYRDWHDINHKRMISHREVFFASPNSFKDKFDCKIPTRWDLLSYGDILDKFYQESIKSYPDLSTEQRIDHAIHWANNSTINIKKYVDENQTKQFNQFDAQTGVLSLTAHPLENRMWNQYGMWHTGFCVGFEPKVMLRGLGGGGGIVHYEDELPIIYPTPKHSFSEQTVLQIFVKLKEWEFEKEYRTYIFRPWNLSRKDRIITVPAEGFKEIILGAEMKKSEEDKLLKLIPYELRFISIRKAFVKDGIVTIKDYK